MNYKYIVVKSTYKIGNTELNSFGIAHIQECDNIPVIFDCIPDISTDMNVIEAIVELCNVNQLEPIHLQNIIDDFLSTL